MANRHYDPEFPGYRSFLYRRKAAVDAFVRGGWSHIAHDPEEQRFARTLEARLRERLPENSKLAQQLGETADRVTTWS